MGRLQRLQRVYFWVAVVCGGLGFVTSAGCPVLPEISSTHLWWLHPLLLAMGIVSGFFSVRRSAEIDRQRWHFADDPSLTRGEREYAHKYAERQRRISMTTFLAAPLMIGYWMAYQLEGGGKAVAAALLPASAIIGAVIGILISRLRERADGGAAKE